MKKLLKHRDGYTSLRYAMKLTNKIDKFCSENRTLYEKEIRKIFLKRNCKNVFASPAWVGWFFASLSSTAPKNNDFLGIVAEIYDELISIK